MDLLARLPENASLQTIAKKVAFMAAAQEGLDHLDRGKRVPIKTVEKMVSSWTTDTGLGPQQNFIAYLRSIPKDDSIDFERSIAAPRQIEF